jgi:hypothetical protein
MLLSAPEPPQPLRAAFEVPEPQLPPGRLPNPVQAARSRDIVDPLALLAPKAYNIADPKLLLQ